MTREGENETPFAENATLLLICTSRKWRETLRFAQGKLLRLWLSASSFDFRSGQGYGARSGTAGAKPMLLSFDGTTKVVPSQQRESIQLR